MILISHALSSPLDYPEEPETSEVTPQEPLSKIVFVNDLPPGETVQFDFAKGVSVYVSSSRESEAEIYEEKIQILRPNSEESFQKMTDAGMNVNSDTGEIKPVFKQEFQISIRNNNAQRASFKNPGIIYFLQESDEKHVSTVYESSATEKRNIFVQSDNIDTRYVTVLNPSGAVKIWDIHHIDGLTALTVSAGGLQEAKSTSFTIHDIGKGAAHTGAPLYFAEPVLTFHKQLSIFAGSSFEVTVKGVDVPTKALIPMTWSDWSLAMSPNYMLRTESKSFKYIFNATAENSQFDLWLFGELAEDSSLQVSYDGIEGAGSESFRKRDLQSTYKNVKGQTVTVEYHRGEHDVTEGVLVRVECSQSSSTIILHIAFLAVFLQRLL